MKMLSIPDSIYDYLLFWECANGDWMEGTSNKINYAVSKPGSLIDRVNWNVNGTTVKGDSGGNTKCGITHATWKSFYDKYCQNYGLTCGNNVNNMDRKGWVAYIQHKWKTGGGGSCANVACGILLFQFSWGGWASPYPSQCLQRLKDNKTKPSYEFKTSGDIYAKIADATHAYENPMDAFQILRSERLKYLWNISNSGTNKKFRKGWMRRTASSFQDDGLYLATLGPQNADSFTSIAQWQTFYQNNKGKTGYSKISSWDGMPTTIETYNADLSTSSEYSSSGNYVGDGSQYSPRFSSRKNIPQLKSHKNVEKQQGTLLAPYYNIK